MPRRSVEAGSGDGLPAFGVRSKIEPKAGRSTLHKWVGVYAFKGLDARK